MPNRQQLAFVLFATISLTFFVFCSNSENPFSGNDDKIIFENDSLSGMVHVIASGSVTNLGTNSDHSKINERPQMQVSFNYNFSIGEHEVTCNEFNSLMEPYTGLTLECPAGDLPATDVSYYDAVLYANARSKAEGLDTAYTFINAQFDDKLHCTYLEGFAFHPDINAYRLPTEAEWILVAGSTWNPQNAWTASNSDYKLHTVCSKADATTKVCDMVGNAMEWVNDWLGYFRDTTLTNYVGAPDGGALGQRIVKGGSYQNSSESISLYGRGDVYTVISSTRAGYVGFRLAIGAIPSATWMSTDGKANSTRIIPIAAASTMVSQTGAYNVKLAFRNDLTGNLAYIDYSNRILSVIEINDTLEIYHPEISPDGKKVAFCTGLEGISGPSSIYIRNLDAEGSGLIKLDVEGAAIPRWRVLDSQDTVIVYVTSAGNNKDESSFKSASTWQVKFENNQFGTPQKLFNGAYHGGISEDNTLAVTGARLLRARIANEGSTITQDARDTVWYGGDQACNASMAKDNSKRTLFLDFGGKTGINYVGKKYGTHERLLIADSTGKLIQSIAAPKGTAFDHSEWATGSKDIAVATLTNAYGAHTKIVLVNIADSSIVELASSEELWHPSLWIQKISIPDGSILSIDSAGIYYDEKVWYNALELRVKMENFWFRRNEVTTVGLGSSRMMFGMYEKNVQSENFLNMAYSAGDMRGMHYLFKNYILQHIPNLKTLVIEMSPDLLWYDISTSWGPIIDGVPGFKYDESHDFWVDGVPDEFLTAVSNCPKPETALMHPYNLEDFLLPTMGWYGIDVFRDTTQLTTADPNYQYDFQLFKEIVQMAHEHNLNVICFIAPQNPDYKKTGSYGVYGPKRSIAEDILNEVKQMDVIWMDENKMGNHDYTAQMAYNMDHLSATGAAQLTRRLDSLLKTLK